MVRKGLAGRVLKGLAYDKLIAVKVVFCSCEYVDVRLFYFFTEVSELDSFLVQIDAV